MSLESYLNEKINGADSQSRIEMYMEAAHSEDAGMRAAGLGGIIAMGISCDRELRHEDFVLSVESAVANDLIQNLIAEYYTTLGYEVSGDCHAWGEPMLLRKPDEITKSVSVTNDSCFASKRVKGPIYVTVAVWPWDKLGETE